MAYDAEKNLTNHPPQSDTIIEDFAHLRSTAKQWATQIDRICPDSREKSLAFTNLEQALMWAVASLARNQ